MKLTEKSLFGTWVQFYLIAVIRLQIRELIKDRVNWAYEATG